MKKYKLIIFTLLGLMLLAGCNDYINNIDPPNNWLEDSKLTTENQIDFMINGILQQNSRTAPYVSALGDLLADAMEFNSQNTTATFPSFRDINNGQIINSNADVTNCYNNIEEVRYYADSLVQRVGQMQFTNDANRKKGLFYGYFYGALMRFYLGAYFGDPPTNSFGATINNSPFIPQATLFNDAIDLFKLALANAANTYDTKVTNTMIAKVYLCLKDYVNVFNYSQLGMVNGDAALQSLNSQVSSAWYWGFAGPGRPQLTVANRFYNYTVTDPKEALERIKLLSLTGRDGKKIYYQGMYDQRESPFTMLTWQENNLMQAEAILRGGGAGDAVSLVNAVRTSHKLDPLTVVDLNTIYVERDKELFVRGSRMQDQYRFNLWNHLPAGRAGFLPIPLREINGNPNY